MASQENYPSAEANNDVQPVVSTDTPSPPPAPPPSSPKKSRTPMIIGAVVIVVLICIVCVVGVVLWRTGALAFLPSLGPKQAAPAFLPADTAFFTSINVDIEDNAGFQHLSDIYGDIPEIEDAIGEFLDEMEDALDITYEDDIKPWLGPEVALSIANMEEAIEGGEPGVIIVAATKDTKASDAFLEKVLEGLEDQGYDIDEESYQKVDYFVATPESEWETPVVIGTVKKSIVMTTDEDTMEDIIDVANGDADSLAKNELYTEVIGALPGDAVAYMFFDLQAWAEATLADLEEGLQYEGIELPSETTEQVEAFQALGMAISLDKEGIQIDVAVTFDPDGLSDEALESMKTEASDNRILAQIPDEALVFISGQDLASAWQSAFAALMETPDFEQQIEDFEDAVGLTIDEELLSWLPGEFGLALVEAKGIQDLPLGGFAVFEVEDRDAAEDTLKDIADALEESASWLEFQDEDIGDVEMQVLMDPSSGQIMLGYGFTEKHLIIGFAEDALELATDEIESITDDETFKAVQKHLPRKTGGLFYMNFEAVIELVYDNLSDWEQEDFDEYTRPSLEPITAMGMAIHPTDPDKGLAQLTVFLYIP